MAESILQQLFRKWSGCLPETIQALPGSGSPRRYFRLIAGNVTAIGVINPIVRENETFLSFTRYFRLHELPVPEIYAVDLASCAYLVNDLGDTTLLSVAEGAKNDPLLYTTRLAGLYRKAVEWLVRFQVVAGRDLDYAWCYPKQRFDRQSMLWDLNYFKYYFLRPLNIPFDEEKLEDDFKILTQYLIREKGEYFMYRDFQARNIMIRNDELFFIDYQGGRKGPLQYDLVSLLFQAKAGLPDNFREEMLDFYLGVVNKYTEVDRKTFTRFYHAFILTRLIQVLGAYGFRGLFEGKPHFLLSIPPAAVILQKFLDQGLIPVRIPELERALRKAAVSPLPQVVRLPSQDRLTVTIHSFAYRNGIPKDFTGNGGGFVFDCRALTNPGKIEEFRYLSGLDGAVKEFLTKQPEVERFLQSVFSLTDQQVTTYLGRGFCHLMVSFGCTGGQHRSVYCAEQLAGHLKKVFHINIILEHTARKNWLLKSNL